MTGRGKGPARPPRRAGERSPASRPAGQRLRRLETLTRLGRTITSSLRMDEVLGEISRAAAVLVDARVASVWLGDETGRTLEVRAWSDAALARDFPRRTVSVDEGEIGWVAAHRQLLHVPDVRADDRIVARSWWQRHRLRSFLGVPLLREDAGRLVAVLALGGRGPFTLAREDREILTSLGAQAATAIGNAEILARVEASERALRASEAQYRSLVEGSIQKMDAVVQLAGGIAHDFNNILTVVTGRCDLLLRRLPPGQPARRDVELIRKAAARATLLTHQLLAFSRKQVLRPALLDVNSVARSLAPMLQRLAGEQVAIVMRLAPDLGRVQADPSQIEQIILNLAVNARDAIAAAGELTIETTNVVLDAPDADEGGRAGPHVLLAVGDSEAGMTAEVQARASEPFFTTKKVGKGSGLGLAAVHGIVKQHGGRVGVDSAPGRGTTVRVYLPRAPEPSSPPHDTPAPPFSAPGA